MWIAAVLGIVVLVVSAAPFWILQYLKTSEPAYADSYYVVFRWPQTIVLVLVGVTLLGVSLRFRKKDR